MARSATDTAGPLAIYRRMQEALFEQEATFLPSELLAEDLVVETPFSPQGVQRIDGREAWLEFYRARALPIRFEEFREVDTHQTDDPDVLVVEFELTGTATTTGVSGSVTGIAVLRVRDGLIVHWREYQNLPAITEALNRRPDGPDTTASDQ